MKYRTPGSQPPPRSTAQPPQSCRHIFPSRLTFSDPENYSMPTLFDPAGIGCSTLGHLYKSVQLIDHLLLVVLLSLVYGQAFHLHYRKHAGLKTPQPAEKGAVVHHRSPADKAEGELIPLVFQVAQGQERIGKGRF